MALFTSQSLGFGSVSGSYYPLAMTFVSPASMVLLLIYGKQLDAKGPRKALRNTTFLCIFMLAMSGVALSIMQHKEAWANMKFFSWTLSQLVVWTSFVFQNSYAHLLYAQQWSFLGSIFTPTQAGKYYSYIAGLSSISSMIAGASVSKLVGWISLPGLLGAAALSLTCTSILADWAYSLSEKHGFDPSMELQRRAEEKKSKQKTTAEEANAQSSADSYETQEQSNNSLFNQIRHGISLFRRVPTLGALFFEALTFQSLSTILSTRLVTQLKDSVPDDIARAAWTGNFYACVNGLSTMFQFFIMPVLTRKTEPKHLWRVMPLLPLLCGIVQIIPNSFFPEAFAMASSSSALYLIALSFLTAKTMDYSLRNILAEMAYVPLSFEARFKGKEIIAVFANRFGKSGMALILSGLHFSSGGSVGLSGLTLAVTFGWLTSAVSLSKLIPRKEEAERSVAERNKSDDENTVSNGVDKKKQ